MTSFYMPALQWSSERRNIIFYIVGVTVEQRRASHVHSRRDREPDVCGRTTLHRTLLLPQYDLVRPRSRCVSLSTSCGWPWDLQSLQELGSWLFSYLLTRWLLRRPEHYRYDSSSYLTVLLSHCIVRPPVFCSIFRTLSSVYTWVCVCVSVCFKFCIESMVDAENGSEVILCVCVSTSSLTQNKTWSRGRRTRYV